MTEYLCLSDLLDADTSSYEFFCTLPDNIKEKIEQEDVRSFDEMQRIAKQQRHDGGSYIN